MHRFPSFELFFREMGSAFKRFPMVILSAIAGTFILSFLTYVDWLSSDVYFILLSKVVMCCELGLCLFLSVSLISELKERTDEQKIVAQALVLVALVVYYFSLRRYQEFDMVYITRYTLYVIAVHLTVSFAPFISKKGEVNGFWQYNKILFLRLLLAFLYTSVLYSGIALALWLVKELLDVEIEYRQYLYVWYFILGIFNTWFFLAGIPTPRKMAKLEADTSYPKGLKVFTQFVLLPLVTVYMLILYAYIGKIVMEWNLPKGYASYLVITFSGIGIFSLLLMYPIRNIDENKWVKRFSKWYYVALYPLIILLAVAIEHRIADYGVTIDRYFIIVLALWLVCIAAYFLWSKKENIKVIPISLAIMAVVVSFGPWGAFSVAGHSQARRLAGMLEKNNILVNSKITKTIHQPQGDTVHEIQSVIEYLGNSDGLQYIQPWFNQTLDSIHSAYSKTDSIMRFMGLKPYHYYYEREGGNKTVYFSATRTNSYYSINVSGFNYYSQFNIYSRYNDSVPDNDTSKTGSFIAGNNSFDIFPSHIPNQFTIERNNKVIASFRLTEYINAIKKDYDTAKEYYDEVKIPDGKFIFDVSADSLQFCFCFTNIEAEKENNKLYIHSMSGAVLTKRKE